MIGWLQGQVQDPWQQAARCGLLLICQGVGYEVQVSQRHWQRLPPPGQELTLHVHQTIREDGWTLFGFEGRQERDLFRELIAVSGVGPQMGMALVGAMGLEELVTAIVEGDGRRLSQAPGVGKRTAERLCLELRQKLLDRFGGLLAGGTRAESGGDPSGPVLGDSAKEEEIHLTLRAMGYEQREILSALRAVASQGLDPAADPERWLGDCLRWLSRSAA
ncbi:MAG: Holliday junction branch migration protein RuvA [Cyanobacteriota bacterium]|nr:Holliday junction branch migration protein RuvA [Cyanobacteriota bacterium]